MLQAPRTHLLMIVASECRPPDEDILLSRARVLRVVHGGKEVVADQGWSGGAIRTRARRVPAVAASCACTVHIARSALEDTDILYGKKYSQNEDAD